jgi:hypothetical protein
MMAVAKKVLIGLCALLGVGALGFGVLGALSISAAGPRAPVKLADLSLRPFPVARGAATPTPTPSPAGDAGVVEPVAVVDAGAPTPPPAAKPDAGAPPPPPPAAKPDAGTKVQQPPPPPPQPVGEGVVNLRASDTADVFVDGKKVGGSPIEGLKVKAGTHKVRFDCYDAAGNTVPGSPKSVTVPADGEASLDYTCPAPE